MAVTNPTAIKFANERARVVADRFAQLYYLAKSVRNEWYANNLGSIFPVGGGSVQDGSDTDGRHPIVADDVVLVINRCEEFIADLEASSNAKLNTILKPAVNP